MSANSSTRSAPLQRRKLVCPSCNTANETGARFCDRCGTPLPTSSGSICPQCRTLNLLGDKFCEQCGTPLPQPAYLIIIEIGVRISLFAEDNDVIIGRSDALSGVAPDIDLGAYNAESFGVSRRHVQITRRNDEIWIQDLNSVNLTYINSQRLAPNQPQRLKDGDTVHLGRLAMKAVIGEK